MSGQALKCPILRVLGWRVDAEKMAIYVNREIDYILSQAQAIEAAAFPIIPAAVASLKDRSVVLKVIRGCQGNDLNYLALLYRLVSLCGNLGELGDIADHIPKGSPVEGYYFKKVAELCQAD